MLALENRQQWLVGAGLGVHPTGCTHPVLQHTGLVSCVSQSWIVGSREEDHVDACLAETGMQILLAATEGSSHKC